MDPLTLSTTFATVVSLVADFRGQRQGAEPKGFAEFQKWLTAQKHEEISALIATGQSISAIEALLKEDFEILREKLDRLDRAFAAFAAFDEDLGRLASAIRPGESLSEQALDLLRQFAASGATKFIEVRGHDGMVLVLTEGGSGQLSYEDKRFIADDLETLVDLGLIRISDVNSSGGRVFVLTRRAVQLIQPKGE
jgi:hypothetical protein